MKDVKYYEDSGYKHSVNRLYDLAIADYSKAIELEPQNARHYAKRASNYNGSGDDYGKIVKYYDLAIDDYTKAIDLEKDDIEKAGYYESRGHIYHKKRQYDLAIADFSKAIAMTRKFHYANHYSGRGRSYLEKGEYDLALADFKTVLAMFPQATDVKRDIEKIHELKRSK